MPRALDTRDLNLFTSGSVQYRLWCWLLKPFSF